MPQTYEEFKHALNQKLESYEFRPSSDGARALVSRPGISEEDMTGLAQEFGLAYDANVREGDRVITSRSGSCTLVFDLQSDGSWRWYGESKLMQKLAASGFEPAQQIVDGVNTLQESPSVTVEANVPPKGPPETLTGVAML